MKRYAVKKGRRYRCSIESILRIRRLGLRCTKERSFKMKKIISLILAMAMCLSLCVQTFAKENDGVNVENVPEMMGILRTDDGKEYTIKGVLVSVAPMSRAANDACSATYRYDLPVSPQANGSTTESDHDGAAASTVYLTIHYTHRNTPTEYLFVGRQDI